MYSTLPETSRGTLWAMVAIEARRFARHPLFLLGVLAAYGVTLFLHLSNEKDFTDSVLAWPIIPAFFIGLPSLVVAARLTRSTEAAVEAMGTAPGTEARRTLAVAGACVVPAVAGILWVAEVFAILAAKGPHAHELWFGTMNDLYVWTILLALGVVSCFGGGVLGVLVGRWLRFPGAPAVAVVVLVALTLGGQMGYAYGSYSHLRLWVPWAMFHTGTMTSGTVGGIPEYAQAVLPGNPVFYLFYVLALCGLAVGGAVWHDRTARTTRLRLVLVATIALAGICLALAMFTGIDGLVISEVLPFPEA